MPSQSDLSPER